MSKGVYVKVILSAWAVSIFKFTFELVFASVEPYFDRAQRDVEFLNNFLIRKVFDISQPNRTSLGFGKCLNAVLDPLFLFFV